MHLLESFAARYYDESKRFGDFNHRDAHWRGTVENNRFLFPRDSRRHFCGQKTVCSRKPSSSSQAVDVM